jgi:16S rRNA (guanine1207-N2)-methyltransferase
MKTKKNQTDEPVALLCQAILERPHGAALVIIDETTDYQKYIPLARRPDTTLLCTHLDAYTSLKREGANVQFIDPPLQSLPESSYDLLLFRISKSKAFTHFVINNSVRLLKPRAELLIAGQRAEGVKTYQKKAATLLGDPAPETKLKSGARLVALKRIYAANPETPFLPDDDYPSMRRLTIDGLSFNTKPGIYGWDKMDVGSRMLASHLPDLTGKRILDLGCGYGYLAIAAHRNGAAEVIATDNDIRAISACRENFSLHNIPGEVVASDCGNELEGPFDVIICNPPFHQGFDTNTDLSMRFLESMERLLAPDGVCLVVCNLFLPYEKMAKGLFGRITKLEEENGFKIIQFQR